MDAMLKIGSIDKEAAEVVRQTALDVLASAGGDKAKIAAFEYLMKASAAPLTNVTHCSFSNRPESSAYSGFDFDEVEIDTDHDHEEKETEQ